MSSDDMKPITLERILHEFSLRDAYKSVVSNRGAADVDGMETNELEDYFRAHPHEISRKVLEGTLKASFRQAPNSSFDYDVKPYKDSSFEAMGSIKFSKANFSFSTDLGLENYQGSGTDSFARLNFGYSF